VGRFLAIVEEGASFSFGGRCHDIFHDSTLNMDGTVGMWVVGWFSGVAEVKVAPNSGSSLGFAEI
jgi:hypothetical protein